MSKYKITLEQFKEFIMPIIEEAKKANNEEVEKSGFKVNKIIEIQQTNKNLLESSTKQFKYFKIEYTQDYNSGHFTYSIEKSVKLHLWGYSPSSITGYLWGNDKEIGKAFMAYMYEHYDEEYKDHVIEFYKTREEENLERINQEREELKIRLAQLETEEKDTRKNYAEEIDCINNSLSNPHQV